MFCALILKRVVTQSDLYRSIAKVRESLTHLKNKFSLKN